MIIDGREHIWGKWFLHGANPNYILLACCRAETLPSTTIFQESVLKTISGQECCALKSHLDLPFPTYWTSHFRHIGPLLSDILDLPFPTYCCTLSMYRFSTKTSYIADLYFLLIDPHIRKLILNSGFWS